MINKQKVALITGITGQDGSYLAEFLLDKGYKVVGIIRRNSVPENQTSRIDHLMSNPNLELIYGDLEDLSGLMNILKEHTPEEIYNLGAQSHVRISFDVPIYTANTVGIGVLNLLEAVRLVSPDSKIYQASSSEMFGNNIDDDGYQRETTPMNPVSPYGCAKVFAYNISRNYRHSYDMFISNGILFNHESPRRGINFVTNKVVREAVRIKKGFVNELALGNLDASRDWSHAKDFVKVMWEMLQLDKSDDFVCASGVSHTVRYLCDYTFTRLEMDYNNYVTVNEKFMRPEELDVLKGDCSKLKKSIPSWKPEYTFETMIDEMISHWAKHYNLWDFIHLK